MDTNGATKIRFAQDVILVLGFAQLDHIHRFGLTTATLRFVGFNEVNMDLMSYNEPQNKQWAYEIRGGHLGTSLWA